MNVIEIIILVLLVLAAGFGTYFFIKKNKEEEEEEKPTPEPEPEPEPKANALWKNARTVEFGIEGGELKDEPINVTGDTNVKVIVEEGDASAITIEPSEGENLKSTNIKVDKNTSDYGRTFKISIGTEEI